MPSLKYTTRVRTQRLRVTVTHNLHLPDANSFLPGAVKSHIRRPKDIDILPYAPQLRFLLSGSVDGKSATADEICVSGAGRHLLGCMRRNAAYLGIHDISDIHVEDGISSISYTSSHPWTDPPSSSKLTLVSIKLAYAWTTSNGGDVDSMLHPRKHVENPITSPRIVTFGSLLDQVVHRLFSHHILQHYPLIFGPYAYAIRAEQAFFPIAAKSLSSIISRSKNIHLKHQALAAVEQLRERNASHARMVRRALRELKPLASIAHCGNDEEEDEMESTLGPFMEMVGRSLTSMFRRSVKPWSKGLIINTHNEVDEGIALPLASPNAVAGDSGTTSWGRGDMINEGLGIEDQDELLDLDWHSQEGTGTDPENENFPLDVETPLESTWSPALSKSSLLQWAQCEPQPAEHYATSLDLDSEDEIMDIPVDESRDPSKIPTTRFLPSHEPSHSPNRLLYNPAHKFHNPSDNHVVTLLGRKRTQENPDIWIHRKTSDSFIDAADFSSGFEDVDSDMEVFEFDLQPAEGEKPESDF